MAQHGYLHDTYDSDDFGRGDDRDRERDWRGRDEDRGWRSRESGWNDRDRERGSMFGWRDDEGDRSRGGDGRGFVSRATDEIESWFGDDDRGDRNDRSSWRDRGDRERSYGGFGGASHGQRRYSAHPDDHYRSWRDKQMEALDRDYQDYCREREQRFHSDFDAWRQNRQAQGSSGGQSQQGGSSEEVLELGEGSAARGGEIPGATTSPVGSATLGTNNSENSATPGGPGAARR